MKINALYIHGIGIQKENFHSNLHESLSKSLKSDEIELVPHTIFWYDEYKCLWDRYVKVTKESRSSPFWRYLIYFLMVLAFFAFFTPIVSYNTWLESIKPDIFQYFIIILAFLVLVIPSLQPLFKIFLRKYLDPYIIEVIWYSRGKRRCISGSDKLIDEPIFNHLEDEIFKTIDALPEREPFVIISHSLGSVIAFDYLYSRGYLYIEDQRDEWYEHLITDRPFLGLVSMGSPISIFVSALGYIPSSLELGVSSFNKDWKPFWLNLYDEDDPAARELRPHFRKIPQLQDDKVNTGPTFFSHLKYWNRMLYLRLLDRLPYFSNQSPKALISGLLRIHSPELESYIKTKDISGSNA